MIFLWIGLYLLVAFLSIFYFVKVWTLSFKFIDATEFARSPPPILVMAAVWPVSLIVVTALSWDDIFPHINFHPIRAFYKWVWTVVNRRGTNR